MQNESFNITIRPVAPSDSATWERLRTELWPDGAEDHGQEITAFFEGTLSEPSAVFLAENSSAAVVGLLELAVRTDLRGLEGERVGYVEGLYVTPEARGGGVARSLLRWSQEWARQQGCSAFASDRADRIIVDRSFLP